VLILGVNGTDFSPMLSIVTVISSVVLDSVMRILNQHKSTVSYDLRKLEENQLKTVVSNGVQFTDDLCLFR
jgi:hypothetical protein